MQFFDDEIFYSSYRIAVIKLDQPLANGVYEKFNYLSKKVNFRKSVKLHFLYGISGAKDQTSF